MPAAAIAGRTKLADWTKLLGTKAVEKKKESELLAEFVRDAFEGVLGYVGPPAVETTIKREQLIAVDGSGRKRHDIILAEYLRDQFRKQGRVGSVSHHTSEFLRLFPSTRS